LGSLKSFKQKIANPIEKLHDQTEGNHHRKLVQPFNLRRMKYAVLQELPSRTEVTMQVEMSNEEAAMYEAQRQQGYVLIVIGIGQLRLLAMARSSSVSWVET
jgi:SNF2 family DNA or RNA helicase